MFADCSWAAPVPARGFEDKGFGVLLLLEGEYLLLRREAGCSETLVPLASNCWEEFDAHDPNSPLSYS
jgi:hypothetical protein